MRLLRSITAPLRKLWVSMLLLVVLAVITVVKIYHASSLRRQSAVALDAKPPTVSAPRTVREQFGQKIADFVLPPEPPRKPESGPPPIPDEIKKQFLTPPTPISLFPPRPAPPKSPPLIPPTYYLPSFRVIRCELIAGPETGKIDTPLLGVVLENQYAIDADGVTRLVIPAGVEVHGMAAQSPMRDRVDGNGSWTFVWRTNDANNAMELTVSALALNRDFDEAHGVYGDAEKSPGIVGRRFETAGDQLLQEALLASAAAMMRDLKSYTSVLNPLTSQVVNQQKPTQGNALLEGAAAGTETIAQKLDAIRKEIGEKGYYVAVLPGKEFYLYTREPFDLRKARRPQSLALGATPTPAAPEVR